MKIIRTKPSLQIKRESKWWSCHTHSRYSNNDALPQVKDIVKKVADLGQPALGLTDHGNMAGSVELYTECMKRGIKPFPGSEMYFVPDLPQYKIDYANKHKKAERYHMGVLAYSTIGYENLVRLSTLSHRNFFHKPTIDYTILAQLAEEGLTDGLAVTTGCYFGYAVQSLIHRGEEATRAYLATLESWFPDSVYVEIQNHNIDHDGDWNDDRVADAMVAVADQMGLPVVITQDSHYLEPDDRPAHESLKQLVSFGPDPDDAVFPGDGFHVADERWMRDHHHERRFARGTEGLAHLLSRHSLRLEVLDSYSYSVPSVVHDPQKAMEKRCVAALGEKIDSTQGMGHKKSLPYWAQLTSEFEIIRDADMAGYMMLVAQVTDYMRENHIIFQTRGSAAGSLVCWLLGISNVDPLKWDLRFERFISRDRTKPPDIDLDIAHDRRDEVIEWLDTKFVAHQIGSWAQYGLDEEDEDGNETGSLRVKYFSTAKKKAEADGVEPIKDWSDVPTEDKVMLRDLADRKMYSGMGTNAAGVVITSTLAEFEKLVPMAYIASRDGYVTQYSKKPIEQLGLVKLDILGSKTLSVMGRCMANLGLTPEHLDDIEFGDKPTHNLIKSGQTEGIFQLEGKSTMWGCKDLKPSKIEDVIAAMALFRPAAMNTGGTKSYIKRKHKLEHVPQRHELIAKVTAPTHGVLLYQEQVIDMLRGLGMDADNLTEFLTAVKASNKDIGDAGGVIESYRQWISQKCEEMGMNDDDQKYLDEAIAGFAEYGFNRAHATVYGITAYRCAYLAAHHPVEFHGGLLAVAAGGDKEQKYLRATRRRGVRVLSAHVNVSGDTYTVDQERGVVRKGLRSVDGVGEVSAQTLSALRPFRDLADLVERSPARPISGGKNFDGTLESLNGVLGKLRDAGALDGL